MVLEGHSTDGEPNNHFWVPHIKVSGSNVPV
jgi:hypothetical protein